MSYIVFNIVFNLCKIIIMQDCKTLFNTTDHFIYKNYLVFEIK